MGDTVTVHRRPVILHDDDGAYLAGPSPAPDGSAWRFIMRDDAGTREPVADEVVFNGTIWTCRLVEHPPPTPLTR